MVSYVEFSNRDEEMMNRILLETDTLLQVIPEYVLHLHFLIILIFQWVFIL